MIKVDIKDEQLTIALTGFDRLYAMRKKIAVPISSITKVESCYQSSPSKGIKIRGSRFGHKSLGEFKGGEGDEFWAWNNDPQQLLISIQSNPDCPFTKVIVGVDHADLWVEKLNTHCH
jgi:hypothetical protein